jgi:hypothetical protein
MQANTVTLTLSDYHALRIFKEEMEKNNVARLYGGGWGNSYIFISKEQAVKEAEETNEILRKELEHQKQENYKLQNPPKPEKKELTITEIKRMTVWEFLKWKRK